MHFSCQSDLNWCNAEYRLLQNSDFPVHKSSSFSHYQLESNDYHKECKVMWGQYLQANDDFPANITANFEHCCVIRFQTGSIDISQGFEADS